STERRPAAWFFARILLRSSKASSMPLAGVSVDMVAAAIAAAVCRGQGGGCHATSARLSLPPRRKMLMNWQSACLSLNLIVLALSASDASAHHVGGRTPKSFRRRHFFLLRPFDHRARPFRRWGRDGLPCRRASGSGRPIGS